jgi:hypothetical protein
MRSWTWASIGAGAVLFFILVALLLDHARIRSTFEIFSERGWLLVFAVGAGLGGAGLFRGGRASRTLAAVALLVCLGLLECGLFLQASFPRLGL